MHFDFRSVFDDVIVRQDVAVGRDDEAGTAAELALLVVILLIRRAAAALIARIGEEEIERIDPRAAFAHLARLDDLGRGDRDDGGHDASRDVRERRNGDGGDRSRCRGCGLNSCRLRV